MINLAFKHSDMQTFMKKMVFALCILVGILVSAIIILRLSGVVQYYVIKSGANEPNISVGSKVFATNLKKPHVRDFICFSAIDNETGKKELVIFRLCATAGDTVQIKKGDLFVNGKYADANTILYRQFIIAKNMKASIDFFSKSHS